jgi:hypothetical protein
VDDFQYKSPDDFAPDDFRRTGKFHYLRLWSTNALGQTDSYKY